MKFLQSVFRTGAILLMATLFGISANALTLRTASQSGSAPKYIKMGNSVGGLEVEIIEAVQKADPSIKIVGLEKWMPFKRIKAEMDKGNLDCFFGFSYNDERAKTFWYIQPPLYKLEYNMVMRAGDSYEPKNFDDIRSLGDDGKVLALFGTAGVRILQKEGGLKIEDSGKSLAGMLRMLKAKRGRFLFYQSFGSVYTIRDLGMERDFRLTKASFNDSGHYLAFPKATISLDVVKQLEAALNKVKASGERTATPQTE